jgi:hypothetical protein
MRSVFTVEIPAISLEKYPTTEDFLRRVRIFGWDNITYKDLPEEDRQRCYREQAKEIWDDKTFPEITDQERDFLIFYGILQDTQTKFMITRVNEGQATFRLLHPDLSRLQSSTTDMIRKLISSTGNEPPLKISRNRVTIFERGYDHRIIQGRVIVNHLREAWRVDQRNLLLASIGFLLTVPSLAALLIVSSETSRIAGGTLERLSTAFISTTVVSLIGFLQTYLEIRNKKLVDWVVTSDEHKSLHP